MKFILFLAIILLKVLLTKIFAVILVMLSALNAQYMPFFKRIFQFKYYLFFLYLGANFLACLVSYELFRMLTLNNPGLMATLLYVLSLILTLIRYKVHGQKLTFNQDRNFDK